MNQKCKLLAMRLNDKAKKDLALFWSDFTPDQFTALACGCPDQRTEDKFTALHGDMRLARLVMVLLFARAAAAFPGGAQ